MLVYIFACEASYGGLHGMYDEDVVEVRDMEEANEYGYEMALGVVESYGCFDDEEDIQSYQYRIYENSYYEEISETEYLKHKGE